MCKHLLQTDDPRAVPLAMLLPRDAFAQVAEERADAVTSLGTTYGATTVDALAARVFQSSAASFLGIQTPIVPVGVRSYNMITGRRNRRGALTWRCPGRGGGHCPEHRH